MLWVYQGRRAKASDQQCRLTSKKIALRHHYAISPARVA